MDLSFSKEEIAFRDEVRRFLNTCLPGQLADKVRDGIHLDKADMEEWHAILQQRSWLASRWPKEWGGPGWSPVEKFLFEHECALAHAPRVVPFGFHMLGPVLIRYGSEAQKRHWLPRMLNGSDWWCQGYSEPSAGSDLAAVKTSAVRGTDAQGDHYIVNGQKIWTTLAQHANMIFCLVRTDPQAKKQQGISFLLVDMNSPGVEVRPIITIDGAHDVNEVFLNDVRVPAENLVGEENRGWDCAKYLLAFERTDIAGVGHSVAALARLRWLAGQIHRGGRTLLQDPVFSMRVARVEVDLENMKTTNLRVLAAAASGAAPGVESSMLKVRGTEIRQEITSLTRRAMGVYALPFHSTYLDGGEAPQVPAPAGAACAAAQYFNNRKLSIYGGSNEIQKNIISKVMLGL
ncbi:Glutaryl-CoA dehydrogenase [Variovorax sp. PBS-H4]|uniref:acyl-CoA dehydrogenase family protein n=1 Tax=Variovorax sp. PBS-H4 TaxID=434008 RepID=UPI0013198ADB|nr:acyl-CoA dehydrogenase family protein [Variovorax sp. PBS-H4]VTU36048.1 Glutaryl-CoA dehydrogenase [Variovorax sp. PBS-H4]